jgi:type I restriction enzyme S subunit
MREWREVTVGEFCPFFYGKSLPENIRREGNIPVASSSGVTGCHDTALVQAKGIIIGRKGTVGKITRIQEPFWPIDNCILHC